MTIDVVDGSGTTILGSSDPFVQPNNDWINVEMPNVPINGPFYGMVKWDNPTGLYNYLGEDQNGPDAGLNLAYQWDGSTWTPVINWGYGGGNFMICAHALIGGSKEETTLVPVNSHISPVIGPAPTAAVKAVSKGSTLAPRPMGPLGGGMDSTTIVGYNIWRTQDDAGVGPFVLLNSSPVTGLTYADVHPNTTEPGSMWYYFVTTPMVRSYDNVQICEPSSDTILITFPAVGVNNLGGNSINVYPNPANDVVNIVSTTDIRTVEVLNYIGQLVYTNTSVSGKTMQLHVSTLQAGVYFVKVTANDGLKTVKIAITH
jgi:hypothetical protein